MRLSLALPLAAAAALSAVSPAAAGSLTMRLTAHVPHACWVTPEGARCNTPPAPGESAGGFGAAPGKLQAMAPRFEKGAEIRSFVAY